tara:strand:- start:214 stop:372 length:159 start_codon:yes stop_codon:yes gene_type:complete
MVPDSAMATIAVVALSLFIIIDFSYLDENINLTIFINFINHFVNKPDKNNQD